MAQVNYTISTNEDTFSSIDMSTIRTGITETSTSYDSFYTSSDATYTYLWSSSSISTLVYNVGYSTVKYSELLRNIALGYVMMTDGYLGSIIWSLYDGSRVDLDEVAESVASFRSTYDGDDYFPINDVLGLFYTALYEPFYTSMYTSKLLRSGGSDQDTEWGSVISSMISSATVDDDAITFSTDATLSDYLMAYFAFYISKNADYDYDNAARWLTARIITYVACCTAATSSTFGALDTSVLTALGQGKKITVSDGGEGGGVGTSSDPHVTTGNIRSSSNTAIYEDASPYEGTAAAPTLTLNNQYAAWLAYGLNTDLTTDVTWTITPSSPTTNLITLDVPTSGNTDLEAIGMTYVASSSGTAYLMGTCVDFTSSASTSDHWYTRMMRDYIAANGTEVTFSGLSGETVNLIKYSLSSYPSSGMYYANSVLLRTIASATSSTITTGSASSTCYVSSNYATALYTPILCTWGTTSQYYLTDATELSMYKDTFDSYAEAKTTIASSFYIQNVTGDGGQDAEESIWESITSSWWFYVIIAVAVLILIIVIWKTAGSGSGA